MIESFTNRMMYDVPVHMNRHPELCEYIHSMVLGSRQWIHDGEFEKLSIVVLSRNGTIIHSLNIETSIAAIEAGLVDEKDGMLPLSVIEEEFRSALVVIASRVNLSIDKAQPSSFRLLAYTVEESSKPLTAVDTSATANSWVLADPHLCDHDHSTPELFPLKSVNRQDLPFKMQLYMKKHEEV